MNTTSILIFSHSHFCTHGDVFQPYFRRTNVYEFFVVLIYGTCLAHFILCNLTEPKIYPFSGGRYNDYEVPHYTAFPNFTWLSSFWVKTFFSAPQYPTRSLNVKDKAPYPYEIFKTNKRFENLRYQPFIRFNLFFNSFMLICYCRNQ
jgi:hypothetical protein